MRTTDKLYNAKVKRAGSEHELGEVGEGLRLPAAGMGGPAELKVAAYRASRRGVAPSYSQVLSQVGSPKLEGTVEAAPMRNGIVAHGHIEQLGPRAGWPMGHLAPGPTVDAEVQSVR